MGDRRVGDRREKEKGVIRIPFKDAVIYIAIAAVMIISLSANIVLAIKYKQYKDDYDVVFDMYYNAISETSKNGGESQDEVISINEITENKTAK